MASPPSPASPGGSYRAEFRQLRAALLQMKEEQTALLDCLVQSKLLRPCAFAASLHRRRFAAALKASPCSFDANLLDVLEEPAHIALQTARYGGTQMMHALKASCRSMAGKLAERRPAIQEALTWLYVCGGSDHQQVRSSVERLDPSSGQWEALPPMLQRRFGNTSAVLDGCLYVCGGSEDHVALNSAERFNPALGFWQPLAPMILPRIHSSALAMHGRLVLCGGHNPAGSGIESIRACECYDPRLEAWLPLPPMPYCRMAACLALLREVLHVCGGFNGREALSSTERLVVESGGWQALPPMTEGRFWAASCVLDDCLLAPRPSASKPPVKTRPSTGPLHPFVLATTARRSFFPRSALIPWPASGKRFSRCRGSAPAPRPRCWLDASSFAEATTRMGSRTAWSTLTRRWAHGRLQRPCCSAAAGPRPRCWGTAWCFWAATMAPRCWILQRPTIPKRMSGGLYSL
ncbi:unnamed protein product [Effrenium voratum]|nr:unnamed protein product [Effrenium voratum]